MSLFWKKWGFSENWPHGLNTNIALTHTYNNFVCCSFAQLETEAFDLMREHVLPFVAAQCGQNWEKNYDCLMALLQIIRFGFMSLGYQEFTGSGKRPPRNITPELFDDITGKLKWLFHSLEIPPIFIWLSHHSVNRKLTLTLEIIWCSSHYVWERVWIYDKTNDKECFEKQIKAFNMNVQSFTLQLH